jgi:hypothetical protein
MSYVLIDVLYTPTYQHMTLHWLILKVIKFTNHSSLALSA